MSTLAQLTTLCKTRAKDISGMDTSTTTWESLLNEGYFEVLSATPFWPFLGAGNTTISLTSSNSLGTLPTDVYAVTSVFNVTDQALLTELSNRDRFSMFPDRTGASNGTPDFYRIQGSTIEFLPWSDHAASIIVEFRTRPAALASGDSPVFPVQYHRLLAYHALAEASLDLANSSAHDRYQARFDAGLVQMKHDLLSVQGGSYPQINDTFGD